MCIIAFHYYPSGELDNPSVAEPLERSLAKTLIYGTLHERFECSEQEAEDLNPFPIILEPLLRFTVLDEMMEAFVLRSHNFWT